MHWSKMGFGYSVQGRAGEGEVWLLLPCPSRRPAGAGAPLFFLLSKARSPCVAPSVHSPAKPVRRLSCFCTVTMAGCSTLSVMGRRVGCRLHPCTSAQVGRGACAGGGLTRRGAKSMRATRLSCNATLPVTCSSIAMTSGQADRNGTQSKLVNGCGWWKCFWQLQHFWQRGLAPLTETISVWQLQQFWPRGLAPLTETISIMQSKEPGAQKFHK